MDDEAVNQFKCATFRYGPNGEAEIFHDSRKVPEGWLDHPAKFANPHFPHDAPPDLPVQEETLVADESGVVKLPVRDDAPPTEFEPIPLKRKEIIAQLTALNVSFRVTATTPVLYTLLLTAQERLADALADSQADAAE